jgi:hypothetical protein
MIPGSVLFSGHALRATSFSKGDKSLISNYRPTVHIEPRGGGRGRCSLKRRGGKISRKAEEEGIRWQTLVTKEKVAKDAKKGMRILKERKDERGTHRVDR